MIAEAILIAALTMPDTINTPRTLWERNAVPMVQHATISIPVAILGAELADDWKSGILLSFAVGLSRELADAKHRGKGQGMHWTTTETLGLVAWIPGALVGLGIRKLLWRDDA